MSLWVLIAAATAIGGVLTLWHRVSRTKHASEEMLKQYADMLSAARERRRAELAKVAESGIKEVPEAGPEDAR